MLRRCVGLVGLAVAPGALACGGGAPPGTQAPAPTVAEVVAVAPVPPPPDAGAAPPVAPADRTLDAIADASCVVRSSGGRPIEPISLRFGGRVFACVTAKTTSIDLRLRAGTSGGTATVETDELALTGEVSLDDFEVRPSSAELRDAYYRVRSAQANAVVGDALTLDVELPSIVHPKARPAPSIACRDLTLLDADASRSGKDVTLREGLNAAIRASPGGTVVADVVTPAPAPKQPKHAPGLAPIRLSKMEDLDAVELERKGGAVRVRIVGAKAEVEGWLPATALAAPLNSVFGMLGFGGGVGTSVRPLVCEHDVPVLVQSGDDVRRVGVVKAKNAINRMSDAKSDEIPIDLDATPAFRGVRGGGPAGVSGASRPTATPFVRTASVADCQEQKERRP